jgi:hypothetical protein
MHHDACFSHHNPSVSTHTSSPSALPLPRLKVFLAMAGFLPISKFILWFCRLANKLAKYERLKCCTPGPNDQGLEFAKIYRKGTGHMVASGLKDFPSSDWVRKSGRRKNASSDIYILADQNKEEVNLLSAFSQQDELYCRLKTQLVPYCLLSKF